MKKHDGIWSSNPVLDVENEQLVLRHGTKSEVIAPTLKYDKGRRTIVMVLGCTTLTYQAAVLLMKAFGAELNKYLGKDVSSRAIVDGWIKLEGIETLVPAWWLETITENDMAEPDCNYGQRVEGFDKYIHSHSDGKYYHVNEAWQCIGPFDTPQLAKEGLAALCVYLNSIGYFAPTASTPTL